jgi:hypothetical protein
MMPVLHNNQVIGEIAQGPGALWTARIYARPGLPNGDSATAKTRATAIKSLIAYYDTFTRGQDLLREYAD